MSGGVERPRRILFVDHATIVGGAQLSLAEHVRTLDRRRFTPHVACDDDAPELQQLCSDAGAAVHGISLPRLRRLHPSVIVRFLRAARELRRCARSLDADIVVAGTSRAAYVAAVALVGTGVPLVWWVRDFLFNRFVFRLFAPLVSRFYCVSEAIRNFYGGAGDPRFCVIVVGSTLHRELSVIDGARVATERRRWGFTSSDVGGGYMGRLVEEKGAEDVVEAIASLHARDARLKLLIVGTGKDQRNDIEPRLKAMVARRGWSFVTFAGFQSDQALYYLLYDVLVLPSRAAEGYGMSAVQAMMARTPVVASAVGGTPELVRDHETGLLVPPASPARIAQAIAELLGDGALWERLVEAAYRQVMAENIEEVTTARAERLYDEIAGGEGARARDVRSVPA
jgi:glycosyltransferase involved in cell wall biosynthesis